MTAIQVIGPEPEELKPTTRTFNAESDLPTTRSSMALGVWDWCRSRAGGCWTKMTIEGKYFCVTDQEMVEFERGKRLSGGKDPLRGVKGPERLDMIVAEREAEAAALAADRA